MLATELVASLRSRFLGKLEARVLIVGLDGSGKSTVLHRLKYGVVDPTAVISTIGYNCECFEYRKMVLSCWDVGGALDARDLWRLYYAGTQAVVFVIDSRDEARLDIVREDLHRMLTEQDLWDTPLLVLANKQDLPYALPAREIAERLQLFRLANRCWHIVGTTATHTHMEESNLYAGVDWLVETLSVPVATRQEKARLGNAARAAQHGKASSRRAGVSGVAGELSSSAAHWQAGTRSVDPYTRRGGT